MQNQYSLLKLTVFPVFLFMVITLASACKSSKSLDNQSVSFEAFEQKFPRLTLPFIYNSDSLASIPSDSLKLINPHHFKLIPATILPPAGDTTSATYALGRGTSDQEGDQWYFLKTVHQKKRNVYVLIYNKKDSLIDLKKVAGQKKGKKKSTFFTFKWSKNHLLTIHAKTTLGNGYVSYKKEVYVLEDSKHLQLILTNKDLPEGEASGMNL